MRFFIICLSILICSTAMAKKEYTPAELKAMIAAGNYPAQGSVKVQKSDMDFDKCVVVVNSMVQGIGGLYPTDIIAMTNSVLTVKVWTNDGAVTMTCKKAERKHIITTAPYL